MRSLVVVALIAVPFALSIACKHDDGTAPNPQKPVAPSAGPAEQTGAAAGETADKAASDVKTGAKDAASAAGSTVEKAGQKMKPDH